MPKVYIDHGDDVLSARRYVKYLIHDIHEQMTTIMDIYFCGIQMSATV